MKNAIYILFFSPFFVFSQINTIGTIVYSEAETDGGFNLIYPHNQSDAFLLDMCGNVVHKWEHADSLRPANVLYILENSDVITTYRPASFDDDAIWAGGGGATVERRTWDNEPVWSFTRNNAEYRLHHDIQPMENGNVLVTAWEQRDSLECIEAGRDPEKLTSAGMWSEVVWVIAPDEFGNANIIWEWAVWDHLIQDFDSLKSNYGVIADNIDKIDINFGSELNAAADWLHINAIDFDEYSQHIMLSVPTFNEIWVVDYGNTTPGELKWRWGNPMAYDRGDSTDTKLGFQHHTHWLDIGLSINNDDYGKIGVFNNRVQGDTSEYSSVHTLLLIYDDYDNQYLIDNTTGTYLPSDFDWTFESPNPNTIYSNIVSSFQRLENGNSLICSGRTGDSREYTQAGELVWHYKTPFLNQEGTAYPQSQGTLLEQMQNLTFRVSRYPSDYAAFEDIDFVIGLPIELDPTLLESCTSDCDFTLSLDSISFDSLGMATVSILEDGSSQINIIECISLSDSTILPISQDLTFTTSQAGDYMITAKDLLGCSDSLVVSIIFDQFGGIEAHNIPKVGLYPNPSNGLLNISFSQVINHAKIEIIDTQGRITFSLNKASSFGEVLDINHLKSGIYFVSISSDEGFLTSKILLRN